VIDLAGRVAVVTGGGGGIGSAICRRLASLGAIVVICVSERLERAEALAASLSGTGHLVVQARVDQSADVAELAALVAATYGRVDVLVNAAGLTRPVPHADLDSLDDELIDRIFRVNWRGSFATVRSLQTMLAADGGGVVINISSIAGITGLGSNVAYCASKAAVDSMTRSLARALAPAIRVVSVSPGWVEGEYAASMPRELLDAQTAATPLGRLATPVDVADAVEAALILRATTGTIIAVDGGRPLGV
jgi:3-oxoacyl-[acyl-carrier protein] reductase